MSKFKVKTEAVIDNNPVGSTIELPKKTAESLADKGYVVILSEVKPKPKRKATPKKSTSATKKAPAKSTAKKTTAKKE